jgi:hypothetical protein
MHPIFRNIAAFLIGLVVGGILNGLSIKYLGPILGVPDGVDPNDLESIKANMHLYEVKHFMTPFIAHCIGSLSGAFVCSMIAAKYHLGLSLGIALLFLFGGVTMVVLLPAPTWFDALDLTVAYFPMAYLGWVLAGRKKYVEVDVNPDVL